MCLISLPQNKSQTTLSQRPPPPRPCDACSFSCTHALSCHQPMVVKVKGASCLLLDLCCETSRSSYRASLELQPHPPPPLSSLPLPSGYGEGRARGCAGVALSQLNGHNTNFKEGRTPCSTGLQFNHVEPLFWILLLLKC